MKPTPLENAVKELLEAETELAKATRRFKRAVCLLVALALSLLALEVWAFWKVL